MQLKWKRIMVGVATLSVASVAYAQTRNPRNTSLMSQPDGALSDAALQAQVQSVSQTVSKIQVQLDQAKQLDTKAVAQFNSLRTQEISLQKQVVLHQAELRQAALAAQSARAAQAVSRASGHQEEGDDRGGDD